MGWGEHAQKLHSTGVHTPRGKMERCEAADRIGQGPEAPLSYSWKFKVSSQMVSDQVYTFQMWSRTWPCELAADRDSLEMRRPQN